jgi:hypothetical protein
VARAQKAGPAYVVIDRTLIPIGRIAGGRPCYSGKHHRHVMNLHVISALDGVILWVSGPSGAGRASIKLRCWPAAVPQPVSQAEPRAAA